MGYEAFLSVRPTSVVHQLGAESTVPLLNGRFFLQALAGSRRVLWAPNIPHAFASQALVRAAIHKQALVGFVLAPQSADPVELRRTSPPAALFRAVVAAVEEEDPGRMPPFFLHVQVPPVAACAGPDFEAVRAHLAACVDAGFTSFGIDLTRCSPAARVALAAALLSPVMDLELNVVIRLGLPEEKAQRASRVTNEVLEMRRGGVNPDLVLLPGPDEIGGEAVALAREVGHLLAPSGVAWRSLAREFRPLAAEAGIPARWLLGDDRLTALLSRSTGAADPAKLEALAYMEAIEQLDALGLEGSALGLPQTLEQQ